MSKKFQKYCAVICCYVALINVVTSQCINQVLPSSSVIYSRSPSVQSSPNGALVNSCGQMFVPTVGQVNQVSPIVSDLRYANPSVGCASNVALDTPNYPVTAVIEDTTLANNLANTLQMMIVCNLLSKTLPDLQAKLGPVASIGCGCGGCSYIL